MNKIYNRLSCSQYTILTAGKPKENAKPAIIAAMHGPHSDFDIGHCTVIHCDAGDL